MYNTLANSTSSSSCTIASRHHSRLKPMSVVSPGHRRGVARCLLRPGAIFPVSGLTATLLFAATNTTNLTSAFKIAPLGVSESDWNAGKPDFPTSVGAIYKHLHGSAGADNDAEKSRVAARADDVIAEAKAAAKNVVAGASSRGASARTPRQPLFVTKRTAPAAAAVPAALREREATAAPPSPSAAAQPHHLVVTKASVAAKAAGELSSSKESDAPVQSEKEYSEDFPSDDPYAGEQAGTTTTPPTEAASGEQPTEPTAPTTTAAPLLNGDGLPFDTPEADLKAVEEQKGTLQASKAEKTAAEGAAAEAAKQLAAQQADATRAAKKAAEKREEVETATAAQQTEEYTASERTGTLKAASEDVDAAEEALKTAQAAEREAETELDLALQKLAAAKAFTGSEQQKLDALERKERAETGEVVDWEARLQKAREALARAQEAEAQAVEEFEALKLEIVEKIHEKNDPGGERWSGLFSRQVLYGAVVVVVVTAGAAAVYFFGAGAWTMVMGPRAGA